MSGLEALTIVASHPPDAVLLDLGMPGMDGYETCRRLRELAWGRKE
ncbi:response regulator [Spirosoma rhododendri]|nr:response regulator [Spirosoma rhododendri]